jgi:hypothetical protein
MPSDADELYGLAFDEFIPARNALARELRGAGRREEAGEVAALRKPSVAAWAVNQLVRTQRRAFDELLAAGDALRAAHDDVLAGRGDSGALRDAVARERDAVAALTGLARGLLTSEGHELSPTIIERVSDTLHAAALEDDARASVREGRLERELRHVGLGMAPGAVRARVRSRQPKPAAKPEPPRDRAAEREARRRLERATRAVATARERRDKAAAALDEAEDALSAAERERADAERALRELG